MVAGPSHFHETVIAIETIDEGHVLGGTVKIER
jgi:hypothetical protein